MRNLWTGWVATEGVPVPSLERKCGPGVKPGSGAAGLASDPQLCTHQLCDIRQVAFSALLSENGVSCNCTYLVWFVRTK